MRSLDLQNQIATLLSNFVTEVKGHTAMGRTDINRVAETVLLPIFREVFGYRDLKNLNDAKRDNYPAIDLGDETARVAIQVTSTPDSDKIKHTLQGFVDHELYATFDRVRIYILTERQKTYGGKSFEKIVQGRFQFDPKQDILDYRDLLKKISTFQVDQLERIFKILDANFGGRTTSLPLGASNTYLPAEAAAQASQQLYLNLLELYFPGRIYIADLAVDREQVIKNSKDTDRPLKRDAPTRDTAGAALKQRGLNFGTDWVCHEGRVITFHDLRKPDLPLTAIINPGTITPLDCQEFYEIDIVYENIFKALLGRCLQQKLYHLDVQWQHQERIFIFTEIDGRPERKEKWQRTHPGRVVYQRTMKNNKPDEILFCKHFGFRTRYLRYGNEWFLGIVPDWFFSFDGYQKSYYSKDKLDWLKRHENDQAVCNHLQFVAAFLSTEKDSDLFRQYKPYSFLSFGNLVTFDDAPYLNDAAWLPTKDKSAPGQMELILQS
jgi:hypothetical protein